MQIVYNMFCIRRALNESLGTRLASHALPRERFSQSLAWLERHIGHLTRGQDVVVKLAVLVVLVLALALLGRL